MRKAFTSGFVGPALRGWPPSLDGQSVVQSSPPAIMSLNVKHEETRRRLRELARLTGETMAEALDRAVLERLERISKKHNKAWRVERLLEIGRECAKLPRIDKRNPESILYDPNGLPK
jgi:antitoxin VapB